MKKCLLIILATLLTTSVLTGCVRKNPLPKPNNVLEQSGEVDPPNASAVYEKLIAYKTENYSEQSVADFNVVLASTPNELTELLAASADVTVSTDDENYDFITTTIRLSANELYCQYMGEELIFYAPISKKSRPCNELDVDGEMMYEFSCFVDLQVSYSINSPKLVTVAERDNTLLTFKAEMQNYLNGLSKTEITDGNIKTTLTSKATELANSLSTENMALSCDISLIEISNAGAEVILQ